MSESGLYVAYAAIGTMAVVPIYYGSFSSLDRLKSAHSKKKERKQFEDFSDSEDEDDDESEAVTTEDAYMFPVYGSIALFSMYMVFKYLNADWVNFLLSGYFALLGVAALTQLGVRVVKGLTGVKLPQYHLNLVHRSKPLFDVRFTNLHLATLGVSAILTALYLWSKNWLVSNLFGLAFSFSAINLIRLDSFKSGMIMLGGLFLYDIFWVFGTEVMVSVAKNFDAPIKVVFPKELLPADGVLKMTMLGLGDIVVPGIFGLHRGFGFPTPYFNSCMAAYVAGLVTTITVMHTFKAAQPALLYLSPACILSVVLTGLARGEISQVFAYAEEASDKKKDELNKKKKEEDETAASKTSAHRHSLRGLDAKSVDVPAASGGELADDEQENVRSSEVLDKTVNAISETSDNESELAKTSSGDDKKNKKNKKGGKAKANKNAKK
ncbi:signal peptide peptidase-domain-containing protein [Kickxella alabastrina]|nr:signal peptide peptidase-domain-containing protein [Kickxella alabastrina]KAI7822122.1 signal peptide peptidase-domain-containing protein [Kickxella alabastrina]